MTEAPPGASVSFRAGAAWVVPARDDDTPAAFADAAGPADPVAADADAGSAARCPPDPNPLPI